MTKSRCSRIRLAPEVLAELEVVARRDSPQPRRRDRIAEGRVDHQARVRDDVSQLLRLGLRLTQDALQECHPLLRLLL